jgi:hypothetical protein
MAADPSPAGLDIEPLRRTQLLWIDGRYRAARNGGSIDVHNPVTGAVIAQAAGLDAFLEKKSVFMSL